MTRVDTAQLVASAGAKPDDWVDALVLPCQLSVEIKVPRFTIRNLLDLRVNSVINSGERHGTHVPLRVNQRIIGWAEFDVVDDRLAVRLTEMI